MPVGLVVIALLGLFVRTLGLWLDRALAFANLVHIPTVVTAIVPPLGDPNWQEVTGLVSLHASRKLLTATDHLKLVPGAWIPLELDIHQLSFTLVVRFHHIATDELTD